MASKAIGFLNFKFSADLTSFERAMNKAQKKLKKFGKNIQKTGQNLSRNLTLPILGLGAAALKFGSDLEETDAKFKTVFSSIQKEAEKTAQSLKENFGLSELAAKEMLSGTGDLLVGFGFTEKKALELSNSVNELAVDLASFTNFSGGAKGASEALTKALLGERESIKSLGIAITETDLKKYAADQGLVWKELDRVGKATLTFEMAQKQSSKAIGDFERTSGSFANQMRILQGDLVDIASEMGARLIPYAQVVIEKFKGLVVWFDSLSDATKDNIVKWGLILAAIGPVLIIIGKVSIGLGVLVGAFKAVGVFLAANPWLAAAAAIAAVGYAIYDTFIATKELTTAQDDLDSISKSAQSSIMDEKIAVELLTNEITAQGISLEDKKIALDKLKKISPEYYGSLEIAKGVVVGLDQATKDYTSSILKQAEAEAMRQKLISLNLELLEIDEQIKAAGENKLIKYLAEGGGGIQKKNIQDRIDALTAEYNITKKLAEEKEQYFSGKKTMQDMLGVINNFPNTITPTTTPPKGGDGGVEKKVKTPFEIDLDKLEENYSLALNKLKETQLIEQKSEKEFASTMESEEMKHLNNLWNLYNQYGEDVIDLDGKILDKLLSSKEELEAAPIDPFESYRGSLGKLGDTIADFTGTDLKLMEEGFASITQRLGDELAQGAESFQEYADNVKGMIKEVIGALISQGIAAAVSKALMSAGVINPFLIPVIAGLAAGLARTAFNSLIPSFADGGIVSGPTVGLMGEYPGAASNPEVVAPLDKLKQYIGGGSQNIIVEGVLKGNDIYLSNKNTSVNRLRTT